MTTRRDINAGILVSTAAAATQAGSAAKQMKSLELPAPREQGGLPLTAALKLRRSTREYSDRPLSAQTLSDLLWAAFGIKHSRADRAAGFRGDCPTQSCVCGAW
jgi:hypothetical protein